MKSKEEPNSSKNMISTPLRRAFFYAYPIVGEPRANPIFVAFHGARQRDLRGLAQRTHQTSGILELIDYPELALNHCSVPFSRHAVSGPLPNGVLPFVRGSRFVVAIAYPSLKANFSNSD